MQSQQTSDNARRAINPGTSFSAGILVGDTLYIAGHLGRDPETRNLVEGGVVSVKYL